MADSASQMPATDLLPLCVDLDGTLIQTDSLWESCLRLVSQNPLFLFLLPIWLLSGKAGFKARVSQNVELPIDSLPFSTAFLQYLNQQKLNNRRLVLVTAANTKIAHAIASQLKIFDDVFASGNGHNLSGSNKARVLVDKFGDKGFVYAGNASVDLKVWKHAAAAVVVNAPVKLLAKARQLTEIEKEFPSQHKASVNTVFKAIRIHQWVKNILIFTALTLAHKWSDATAIQLSLLAFFSFSFAASSIYLINDLLDLEADRKHETKRFRPLAAGTLSIPFALGLVPLLILLSYTLAFQINTQFIIVLTAYLVLTTAYSLYLKPLALLDVFTLTSLYTTRIIAGAFAITVPISHWLLAFSMFIFLSLALIKRYSELRNLSQAGQTKTESRGYHVDDLNAVSLFGISSGYISVMVMVLYIHDLQASTLYQTPGWLWLVAVTILYWISHMWLLAFRGKMNEDPVLFAIHDRSSYFVAIITGICLYLAL